MNKYCIDCGKPLNPYDVGVWTVRVKYAVMTYVAPGKNLNIIAREEVGYLCVQDGDKRASMAGHPSGEIQTRPFESLIPEPRPDDSVDIP